MKKQVYLKSVNELEDLDRFKVLLVFNGHFSLTLPFDFVQFYDFSNYPTMQQVMNGCQIYLDNKCEIIVAVGGGSTIDVAKGIKQQVQASQLICVPTTAGSGSEANGLAYFYDDKKRTVLKDDDLIADFVVFQASFLSELPLYQKRDSWLTALSQSIMALNSQQLNKDNEQVAEYTLKTLMKLKNRYLKNSESSFEEILLASYYAGQVHHMTSEAFPYDMVDDLIALGLGYGHASVLPIIDKAYFDPTVLNIMGVENQQEAIMYLNSCLNEFDLVSMEDIKM